MHDFLDFDYFLCVFHFFIFDSQLTRFSYKAKQNKKCINAISESRSLICWNCVFFFKYCRCSVSVLIFHVYFNIILRIKENDQHCSIEKERDAKTLSNVHINFNTQLCFLFGFSLLQTNSKKYARKNIQFHFYQDNLSLVLLIFCVAISLSIQLKLTTSLLFLFRFFK